MNRTKLTRILGVGLVTLLLTLGAGFASGGVMADGGTTTATNTTTATTAMNATTAAATTTKQTTTAVATQTATANQTTTATSTTETPSTATETTATKTTTGAAGTAQVRFAHMSPDAPPVDVIVDDQTAVSNLSYGNVTDYATISAGEHNVTITAANDPSTVVFSGNVTFAANTNYTATATGLVSGSGDTAFEPVVFEDNFTAPGPGNASVRLVHVSPDAPTVDVTIAGTNTTLFDNVSFRNATAYEEVPAGNYTLEVRTATANDSGQVLQTFDVTLNQSTVYSAFAAGYADPTSAPAGTPQRPFELILVTDFVGAQNVTTTATTTAATTTAATTAVNQTATTAVNTTAATETTPTTTAGGTTTTAMATETTTNQTSTTVTTTT